MGPGFLPLKARRYASGGAPAPDPRYLLDAILRVLTQGERWHRLPRTVKHTTARGEQVANALHPGEFELAVFRPTAKVGFRRRIKPSTSVASSPNGACWKRSSASGHSSAPAMSAVRPDQKRFDRRGACGGRAQKDSARRFR
ncbi:hypothetical protein D0B32_27630 [Paraburkholderia sp. DHOC27]|nr:hypothetical protein D0B32_27630 [Paraburkholderia sp. DHOC27]